MHTSPTFERVADFVFGLDLATVPEGALAVVEDLLLDTLGIAAAATATDAGRIARDTACALFAAGSEGDAARILFDGRRASTAGAAYAAATQIDNLDGHDGYAPSKGHIGVAVIPALFAFAEGVGRVSGDEALAALVVGYELASRAGVALHGTVADYHTSGAWNALAVAAMGARLMGLDREQLRQALGIAEYHGPRSQMMREIDNPSMLHDGSGWGALAGVSAAVLARRGFTGAPAVTVEGAEAAPWWEDLGSAWLSAEQYIKPYPVCRWAHAPIDGILLLARQHDVSAGDVEAVEIRTFHESACLAGGMPDTTSRAQYSLAFPVAAALVRGTVGPDEVMGSGLRDSAIAAMVEAVKVFEDEKYNERFPAGRWGDVTLVLKDGRRLNSGEINARGGPDAPLSRKQVLIKFREFAEPVIGGARADAIADLVFALREDGNDLGPLANAVTAPA